MTFFNWMPSQETDIISPWLVLYFGLAAMLTGGLYWWWKRLTNSIQLSFKEDLREELGKTDSMILEFSKFQAANAQIHGTNDSREKGDGMV